MTDKDSPDTPRPKDEITFGDVGALCWRRLKEMRTVFYLLIAIAIGGMAATVLPQGQPAGFYLEKYGQLLGNIVLRTGLNHVSTALWFVLLLTVLMLSLLACSRNLWTIAGQRWRLPDAASVARQAGSAKDRGRSLRGDPEGLVATAITAARRRGFRCWDVGSANGGRSVYLCRNRLSAWGGALAHYSVFLVGVGALLGALPSVSVDQYVDISEGNTFQGAERQLPFDVKLHEFRIDEDPVTHHVKQYYSDLSLLQEGKEIARKTISVNQPLRYGGFYLSQSSWGLGVARVRIKRGGQTMVLEYPLARGADSDNPDPEAWGVPGDAAAAFLPDGTAALVAAVFLIDAERKDGEIAPGDSESVGTPALKLVLVSGLNPGRGRPQSANPDPLIAPAAYGGPTADFGVFFAGATPQLAQGMGSGMQSPHGTDAGTESPRGSGSGMESPHGMGGAASPHDSGGGSAASHGLKELGWVLMGETLKSEIGDITFAGVTESSGIGIRRDPGVTLVWLGFIGCLVGLVLMFYLPLEQGYVALKGQEGQGDGSTLQLRLRGGLMSNVEADTARLLNDITAAGSSESRGAKP